MSFLTELLDSAKKEDVRQLKSLLPVASNCFLAGLLPIDVFSDRQNKNSMKVSWCQHLKQFFEQSQFMSSAIANKNINNQTVILYGQLTVPGPYTFKSYKERVEMNFQMERAGEAMARLEESKQGSSGKGVS